MPIQMYEQLRSEVMEHDAYFQPKKDATGLMGASTDQKLTSALRQLSLGISSDAVSEISGLKEYTNAECLKRFCMAIVSKY